MSEDNKKKRQIPKGGRKGGTQFPQVTLAKAAEYAKKLVSKTHTGPQPAAIILKGAFDNAGPQGQVRAGAMKQYGLLNGKSDAYTASQLARDLVAAPPEESNAHLQAAFLRANVFKTLYDTFVDDTVIKAKISQQASALKVHPDSVALATQLFVEGAQHAGLAKVDGENITIIRPEALGPLVQSPRDPATDEIIDEDDSADDEKEEHQQDQNDAASVESSPPPRIKSSLRAVATVAIKVDSSTHTDDLEKQLKLLRKFGVI